MPKDETYDTLKEDVQTLTSLLVPFLEEIHSVLILYGLDRLKSTENNKMGGKNTKEGKKMYSVCLLHNF
uniref:Uncharacterized protein n=1 Tax=Salix viminalis TaxID=40686 RepID=A0A6N2MHH0_SALVM